MSVYVCLCYLAIRESCHQRTPGRHQAKFPHHQYSNKAVDKRTRNNLYMRLDLAEGKLDQV